MNNISIPYHLIVPSVASIFIIGMAIIMRKRYGTKMYWKSFWISTIVSFGLYSFIVGFAAYQDISMKMELNEYDLNANGFFEGNECMNESCKELMRNLTNDTGRNFSILTGGIKALVVSIPVFLIGIFVERFKNKNFTNPNL